jgi:hypothetical protein
MVRVSIVVASLLLSEGAANQGELNAAACTKTKAQQRKLDDGLRELFRRTSRDIGLTTRLRHAEDVWLKFKEAQLQALYGVPDPGLEFGSVWPMCSCEAEEQLIRQRLADVNRMLNRVEGDVCSWVR